MDERENLRRHLAELEAKLAAVRDELNTVTSARAWRLLQTLYYGPKRRLRAVLVEVARPGPGHSRRVWTVARTGLAAPVPEEPRLTRGQRVALRAGVLGLPYQPLVSILMPVTGADHPSALRRSVAALRAQVYPHWELVLSVCPMDAPYADHLMRSRLFPKVRVRVAVAAPHALARDLAASAFEAAKGEVVSMCLPGEIWRPAGLATLVEVLNDDPRPAVAYGDELIVEEAGHRRIFLKPDWSPEYFLATGYVGRSFLVERSAVVAAGGARREYYPAEEMDLLLRVAEQRAAIVHVPRVVYETNGLTGRRVGITAARRRVVEAALHRRGELAWVREEPGNLLVVRREVVNPGRVSVIVPFRDGVETLRRCVETLLLRTDYPDLDLVLVDNDSRTEVMGSYLATVGSDPRVRVLRVAESFNFSRLCNVGAAVATGRHLLFLNSDTEGISPEWLSALLEHGQRPEVGAVGAKLLYPDGRVQHAGIVFKGNGQTAHAYRHALRSASGEFYGLEVSREVSAVSAACLLTRRSVFEEVGGFDADNLPIDYNDVDYCLKLRQRGYAVIYCPHAEVYHLERQSRGLVRFDAQAAAYLEKRWGAAFSEERYTRVGSCG